MTMEEPDSLLIAKMDSVAFRTTLPMKIAFVTISEKIVDFCDSYIASLDTENMEARVFGDEAAARQWVEE
jgi:predicted methyltransferase